jgi:hypothetical protein
MATRTIFTDTGQEFSLNGSAQNVDVLFEWVYLDANSNYQPIHSLYTTDDEQLYMAPLEVETDVNGHLSVVLPTSDTLVPEDRFGNVIEVAAVTAQVWYKVTYSKGGFQGQFYAQLASGSTDITFFDFKNYGTPIDAGALGTVPIRFTQLFDVNITALTDGKFFKVVDNAGTLEIEQTDILEGDIIPNFAITSFTLQGGNIIELGTTVFSATFDYVCNRAPTTLVLTNDEGYPPLNVPTPLIADEIESDDYFKNTHGATHLITLTGTENNTDVATVTIYYYAPMYYGLSASDLTSEANIKTLTKVLDADHNYSVNFASGASRYIYITVLASLDITSIFVGGFESFVDFTPTTLNMTHNGNTSSYKRYKSNAPVTSAYTVTWS